MIFKLEPSARTSRCVLWTMPRRGCPLGVSHWVSALGAMLHPSGLTAKPFAKRREYCCGDLSLDISARRTVCCVGPTRAGARRQKQI
eukprot:9485863-Pyramimonas_sp.AAC.1